MRAALSAAAVVLMVGAAGCGGGGDKSGSRTTTPTVTWSVTTHGRYHYPPALINSYMQSCVKTDQAKQAYCACTLDELSNDVSVQDFARVGLAGGTVPSRLQKLINQAAKACKSKL